MEAARVRETESEIFIEVSFWYVLISHCVNSIYIGYYHPGEFIVVDLMLLMLSITCEQIGWFDDVEKQPASSMQ